MKVNHNFTVNKLKPTKQTQAGFVESQTFQKISFAGMPTYREGIEIIEREIGASAGEHFDKTIKRVLDRNYTGIHLENGTLRFDDDSVGQKFYRALAEPLLYLPIDLANSTLNVKKQRKEHCKGLFG
jgi:hypothetical protein